MKVALNHLGYYTPYKKTGITDIPDTQVFEALKKFQKDQGLPPTGDVRPDDETVKALNSVIFMNLQPPVKNRIVVAGVSWLRRKKEKPRG